MIDRARDRRGACDPARQIVVASPRHGPARVTLCARRSRDAVHLRAREPALRRMLAPFARGWLSSARYLRAHNPFTALRPLLLALALAPLAGCGDDGGNADAGDVPEVDCAATPAPKYSEMANVWAKCTACHAVDVTGAARGGAPPTINFDTYAAAKAEASTAMHEVYEGAMPPAASPQLSAAEEDQLYRWASCGTPE